MRFNLEMTRKYTIPFLLRIILLENNGDYPIHAIRISMNQFRVQDWLTNVPLYTISNVS